MIRPRGLTPEKISIFKRKMLSWGRDNFSVFPWRNRNRPFHSLIVELLLQRTKAEQVVPVYLQLKHRFPSAKALAAASLEDIEKLIYSLGLKWRACNILILGQKIYHEYGGVPPLNTEELRRLPGVGPYAAGAYLSLHSDTRAIIPDANMVRILGRVFGFTCNAETRKDRAFLKLCDQITPKRRFKGFNYAILDFGRKVCTPRDPKHAVCPIKKICYYYRKNYQ